MFKESALLDEGSEIVVIWEDAWRWTNTPISNHVNMMMQMANGSSQPMQECVEMLKININSIKTWAHAYVVPDAPYQLLLGCPWQQLVQLEKHKTNDDVYVTVHDLLDPFNITSSLHHNGLFPRKNTSPSSLLQPLFTVQCLPLPWAHL